ncbi:MAG: polymer-forming cytoskeletal protein [Gammaproteobacteria bacterium]|nr:polymer-forming cytoskeletal protein [Gammaproteobacteria bacterium]
MTASFTIVLATDDEQDIKATGAKIRIISENATNIYAAGARVTIEGKAKQDIWAAGALLDIDIETAGDLHAAGSRISVKGKVAGKARLAGADLKIDAEIGEILNAAAASIEISENAKLPANTSLAGALIEFHGAAKDNLSLYADEVVFSGQASGTVTIEGRNVQLDDTARIEGNLIIRSSEEAVISPNAIVVGEFTQTGLEDSEFFKEHDDKFDGRGFFLILSTSIFLLGLILVIFARSFVEQGITTLRAQPGRSILLGLAVFFGIPLFVIASMFTILGIPIGVATLLLLPFLFILGFTTTTLGVSDWLLNRHNQPKKTGQRLLLLAAGVVLLVIIGFIPFLGGLLLSLALLFGLGVIAVTIGHVLNGKVLAAQM